MNNYTTIKRNFKHLTSEKRAQIEILIETGMSKADVARTIGIARSTLYEELKRGTAEAVSAGIKRILDRYSKCADEMLKTVIGLQLM